MILQYGLLHICIYNILDWPDEIIFHVDFMLVNCWPSWPSFDWMCSQLMVKTTEIKKSQVTWSARCKWFGEHHSMDWFCWENLHRKPSQFSHEIWGFPVTIFPTKPIRWIFIHYWSTIGYYFNWLSYFFRGVGIPSTSHGTSFFLLLDRKHQRSAHSAHSGYES